MARKILIIEDDVNIMSLIKDYLEIEGFTIEQSTDGAQGLQKALTEPFSLILLDVMLPGLQGFEICRRIRKQSDVPILFLSARKEDSDKIRGLGLGADDYITKPFSPGELAARIKAHIRRYDSLTKKLKDSRKNKLAIKEISLDIYSRRTFIQNKEVILTEKEFEILYLFMRYPDRVFSKEEIFERIWGEGIQGDTTTVTVHIRRLREKIEPDPSAPLYLETVWGMGYRLKL